MLGFYSQIKIQEQRHAGTPTDLRVGTAVALSSVAKYWVLTNLFPGPIPQVSVYGLHPPRPCDGSKPQDGLSQHQQHCLPALPPPPGVNMATDTMSLLPQHPHSQVAGLHMDQGPLDNSDKNKIDKGTCTVERCGDNQVHCQLLGHHGRFAPLADLGRFEVRPGLKAVLARRFRGFMTCGWLNDHPTPLSALYRIKMIILWKNPGMVEKNTNSKHSDDGEYVVAKVLKDCGISIQSLENTGKGTNKDFVRMDDDVLVSEELTDDDIISEFLEIEQEEEEEVVNSVWLPVAYPKT
uniref:(California timema) hypothetical protein n=1 Tax=Timema californicum TaxID=61474 RepID=A0A7R9IY72_TIMCA|nr:unnamed protein product [Timema californicum]